MIGFVCLPCEWMDAWTDLSMANCIKNVQSFNVIFLKKYLN